MLLLQRLPQSTSPPFTCSRITGTIQRSCVSPSIWAGAAYFPPTQYRPSAYSCIAARKTKTIISCVSFMPLRATTFRGNVVMRVVVSGSSSAPYTGSPQCANAPHFEKGVFISRVSARCLHNPATLGCSTHTQAALLPRHSCDVLAGAFVHRYISTVLHSTE